MAQRDYTKYQQKIISNYYQNMDTMALQRLQELVTELFLADTDKKRQRLWEQAEKAIEKLDIKPAIKKHILESRDVQVLAKNVNEWLTKK
ncbi:MAG: hypothetical protein ABFD91_05950 [Anaerohalosphaeraceae bacterium]